MKIAGLVAIVLALVFVVLAVSPLFDLRDEGQAIAGLDASADTVFTQLTPLIVIVVGVIFVICFLGLLFYVFGQ